MVSPSLARSKGWGFFFPAVTGASVPFSCRVPTRALIVWWGFGCDKRMSGSITRKLTCALAHYQLCAVSVKCEDEALVSSRPSPSVWVGEKLFEKQLPVVGCQSPDQEGC